jgi:hypothetical protein
MANVKGRGVKVEFAATFAAALAVTALTNANPAVATATAHGKANNSVGFMSGVTGMEQIEGQAVRLKNGTANTFELQGLNTTSFGTYTAGDLTTAATWVTLAESTSYSIGGGSAEKLDATRLLDTVKIEEQGLLPTQTVNIGVLAQDTPSAAMQILQNAVQQGGSVLVRITLPNGAVRIFYGEPSLPGEDVQKGQLGTGSLDFTVKGVVLYLAA